MKKLIMMVISFSVVMLGSIGLFASDTSTEVEAKAEVKVILGLNTVENLDFGVISIVPQESGTVKIDNTAKGTKEFSGDDKFVAMNTGNQADGQAALVRILGQSGEALNLSFVSSDVKLNGRGDAEGTTLSYKPSLATDAYTIPEVGILDVYIGGEIDFEGTEKAGHYEGTFEVQKS